MAMKSTDVRHPDLQRAATAVMRAHGFDPEFSPEAQQQVAALAAHPPPIAPAGDVRDLRDLPWSSIDNDTSRDLDQVECAERLSNGQARVRVGIADVDSFVGKGTPIDAHAAAATTSVYTGVRMFPMLPEPLSTGATSLLEAGDRLALVIEFVVDPSGHVVESDAYRGVIRNKAQLAYIGVGAWLEGKGPAPAKLAASPELQAQVRLQDEIAQALRGARHRCGALNIETIETRAVIVQDAIVDIVAEEKSRATELIEDFMIASNEAVARLLDARKVSALRRVVKTPERWERIVALASALGTTLPAQADSKALNDFLVARRAADPDHFSDLSLSVIKLMGPGEYVLERPGDPSQGHFGLAVADYTHSTAPNRRFADLVTQRITKAVLTARPAPYSDDELAAIARACTEREDAARKVEREMTKRIAAVAMSDRVGSEFDAIVTGATARGTFVRVVKPHVEGMLVAGAAGVDVGDRLRVRLVRTDVERGFIDFARV
jgi:exoribonuclease-2